MIELAFYVIAIALVLTLPVLATGRYLEWRAWDTERRIGRLRKRYRA
jgi:hypothetical protein